MSSPAISNYEEALQAETKKVVRIFHHYTTDQVSLLYSRGGRPSRKAIDRGEFFYTHPDCPGVSFPTRGAAAKYALESTP